MGMRTLEHPGVASHDPRIESDLVPRPGEREAKTLVASMRSKLWMHAMRYLSSSWIERWIIHRVQSFI